MTIADINTLARFLTKTNTTSLSAANLLILVNKYYEAVVGKIISETAGGLWQFGDFNYTAFPTFTLDLANGTQAYDLGDTSTDPLTIMGVEVADQDGNFHVLRRITLKQIHEFSAEWEYLKDNGLPDQYEI